MPNNIINKDAKRGKGTKKQLEQDWERADDAAKKTDDSKDRYALTNYIYDKISKKHARDGHKHSAAAEDFDPAVDDSLSQPGVDIRPTGPVAGNGAGSPAIAKTKGATMTFTLNAAARIKALRIDADAFEGWINSLQFKYERPSGADYVILDATPLEVMKKLKADGWTQKPQGKFTKGEHTVQFGEAGNKTKLKDVK